MLVSIYSNDPIYRYTSSLFVLLDFSLQEFSITGQYFCILCTFDKKREGINKSSSSGL